MEGIELKPEMNGMTAEVKIGNRNIHAMIYVAQNDSFYFLHNDKSCEGFKPFEFFEKDLPQGYKYSYLHDEHSSVISVLPLFKEGNDVLVRDVERGDWIPAKFKYHDKENTKFPYFVRRIDGNAWYRYCKHAPKYEDQVIKLNNSYEAIVKADHVVVGCQQFQFDAIFKLHDAVVKAEAARK